MDTRFLTAFENRIGQLIAEEPFTWIHELINEKANDVLRPSNMSLRADAILFLLINIAEMIVKPWDVTEGRNFRDVHRNLLAEDVQDIMGEAQAIASAGNIREISANLLLNVTATRRSGMRTRGLNIWGP